MSRFDTIVVHLLDGTVERFTCSEAIAHDGVLTVTDSDHRSGEYTKFPMTSIKKWEVNP